MFAGHSTMYAVNLSFGGVAVLSGLWFGASFLEKMMKKILLSDVNWIFIAGVQFSTGHLVSKYQKHMPRI